MTFCPWESPQSDSEPENDDDSTAPDGDTKQNDDDTQQDDGDTQQNDDATAEQNNDTNQNEADTPNTSEGDAAPPTVGLVPSAPTLEYSSTSLEKSTIELNVIACTSAGGTS